jgi:hypothetical protein
VTLVSDGTTSQGRGRHGGGLHTYPALGRQLWLHMAVRGKSAASPVTLILKQLVNIRPYSTCDLPPHEHTRLSRPRPTWDVETGP